MPAIRHLLCVLCLAACPMAGTSRPPNIILITLDTVRADRMGFLGSHRGLTPTLDSLARQSVVFTRAYSQVPLTAPSHATILTGTYPQFHQVQDFEMPLGKDLPYAPAILRAHGYHTAAFVGSMVLDPGLGLAVGFDRGFDTYDAGFHPLSPTGDRYKEEDRYKSEERRADDVVAHALGWLQQHSGAPFFMWVHLYDPHDPYDPPEPYKSKYAAAPYDGEIAYTDSAVGKFLRQLRTRGFFDGALVAVMADHGESLGDHGEDFHGFFLYDETIHVPLLIKLPGETSAGKRIETRVELVDVLPTILEAVGIAIPQEVQGESLLGMMNAEAARGRQRAPAAVMSPDRPAYSETDYAHLAYGWSSLQALRTGKYLYVDAPRPELYDQTTDPKAQHDLTKKSAAVTDTIRSQLNAFRQKTSSTRELPKLVRDPEAEQKLAALGYVASDPNASKTSAKDLGADPKDKIETANLMHRENVLQEEGNCSQAVPLLRQLIVKEPGMVPLYRKLCKCLILMKEYQQAVPVVRKLVELNPDSADAHFQLGGALIAVQDFAAAVPELQYAVAREPQWAKARLTLAYAFTRTHRIPEAVEECNKALEASPDNYEANLLLGRILVLSEDYASAVPKLKKAAALEPNAPEPHQALSAAYRELGQPTEAEKEQSEAKRLASGPSR
jgi:choline-sulfatase